MRDEMSHDGQTASDRIKNERLDNKMLSFREKVALTMSLNNQGRNRLESLLVSIVPRTGQFAVVTSLFAVAVHHRLSADRKCDTESRERVEKADRDPQSDASDDDSDRNILDGTHADSPDPTVELRVGVIVMW